MLKSKSTIANTLVDRRGHALTKKSLEMMVSQIKKNYMPVNIEHDPRTPIQGRISDAYLQERNDGEFEIVAEIEIFDESDSFESTQGNKEIIKREVIPDGIIINYDRNFDNDLDKGDIDKILEHIKGESSLSVKNSIDPISVLQVVALVGFGAISKGFLSKMGGDTWEFTRNKLKSIFSRKKEGEKEKILSLSFRVTRQDIEFDVDVLATNPTQEEIDSLFTSGLKELDKIVPILYQEDMRLHKMVFEYKNESIEIKYAVTKDCFSLSPNIKVINDERHNNDLAKNKE